MSNPFLQWRQADPSGGALHSLTQLLQTCRQRKDLAQAKRLHAYLRDRELETHPIIGNFLIPMLVDCGCLPDAHCAFDRLLPPHRNVYSWTSLISGFIHSGETQYAFHLYHQMHSMPHCVQPNRYTYLALLNACAQHKDAERGHTIHSEIMKAGLDCHLVEGSAVIGNTLVDLYGKCSLLLEARHEFDRLPVRDAVSWNALIAGYAEHGLEDEMGTSLQEMQMQGLPPDYFTFVSIIKACGTKGTLKTGVEIYDETTKKGLDRCLGNAIINMYMNCGSLLEAHQVFNWLPVRDAVSWNTLITGYADCGLGGELGCCFEQMQCEGVSPDYVTFVCSLTASGTVIDLDTGRKLHTDITKRGIGIGLFVGNALLDMYTKCSLLAEAREVFEKLPARDTVSWNALIAGYSEHGFDEEVLHCFIGMQLEGVPADIVTFLLCLKACGTVGALEMGQEIHVAVSRLSLQSDLCLGNMLIDMYGKCGSVADGREVFNLLPNKRVVSWNAMIKAYGENHEGKMAAECFEEMQFQGVNPDSITFTSLIAACSHISMVLKGQEYFTEMREKYSIKPAFDHHVCMVDLYTRSGHILEAEKVVASMQCPPCSEILVVLLNGCKIYGKVELAQRCFHQLVELNEDFAVSYLLMADIYASAGRWNDATRVENWRKLAGARKKAGRALIEIGKRLYEFGASVNQSEEIVGMLGILCSGLKWEGHVPSLELVCKNTYHQDVEIAHCELAD